ncbi:hypothetical protein B0H11DRAFT_1993649 [Mycena galericulata]|nr:hypothetical protein B0H11DRAFT_1993649 [Mycena galericulata]
MVRISSVVFSLFAASCALAAPMHRRQVGDLACDQARLLLLFNIRAGQDLLANMTAPDLHDQSRLAVATAGLNNATGVVQGIFGAVLSGGTAAANSRNQTVFALNVANASLAEIKNPSMNASVAAVMATVLNAGTAADAIGATC